MPAVQQGRVPAITVWALRGQLGVVYVLRRDRQTQPATGCCVPQPLQHLARGRTDRPLIGPLLDDPFVGVRVQLGGRRVRPDDRRVVAVASHRVAAYACVVVFHVTTAAMLFQIGVFPWVMIALTPIFFATDWPTLGVVPRRSADDDSTVSAASASEPVAWRSSCCRRQPRAAAAPLAADGNVRWNDDGYLLSWRVMLTERAGHVVFDVTDPSTGVTYQVGAGAVLDDWQAAAAMVRADLVLSTAHLIADEARNSLGRRRRGACRCVRRMERTTSRTLDRSQRRPRRAARRSGVRVGLRPAGADR